MKKFRKKIVVFALIILIGFVVSRIYCFVIVNRVYCAINQFREAENRYYAVTTVKKGKNATKLETFYRNNKIKYLQFYKNHEKICCGYKDFNTDEKYFWVIGQDGSKIFNEGEKYIMDRRFIIGVPNILLQIYLKGKFNPKEFFRIYYIIPVKYENKKCYKIVTKYETIIIDKETFLPKYSCKNWVNSEDDNACKMEYFYEFEINTVTEEDMQKL